MKSRVWAPDSEGGRGKITRFVPGGRRGIWPDLPRGCGEHGGLGYKQRTQTRENEYICMYVFEDM